MNYAIAVKKPWRPPPPPPAPAPVPAPAPIAPVAPATPTPDASAAQGEKEAGSKKKKKKKEVGLLDLSEPKLSVAAYVPQKVISANAARWAQELVPKTFLVSEKGPPPQRKKQRFSVFKKKVLLERVRLHVLRTLEAQQLDVDNQQQQSVVTDSAMMDDAVNSSVVILNFLEGVDLTDEEELRECATDALSLLQPCGKVLCVNVMRTGGGDGDALALVEVVFAEPAAAITAVKAIDGIVCGGNVLQVRLRSETVGGLDGSEHNLAAVAVGAAVGAAAVGGAAAAPSSSSSSSSPCYVLRLRGLVRAEDVQEVEEVQELLADLQGLCADFGALTHVWVERRKRRGSGGSGSNGGNGDSGDRSIGGRDGLVRSQLPWAFVLFSSAAAAVRAAGGLAGGVVVGGSRATACLYDFAAYCRGDWADRWALPLSLSLPLKAEAVMGTVAGVVALRLRGFTTTEKLGAAEDREKVCENALALFRGQEGQGPQGVGGDVGDGTVIFALGETGAGAQEQEQAVTDADVIVPLPSLTACLSALRQLAGVVVGGAPLLLDIVLLQAEGHAERQGPSPVLAPTDACFSYARDAAGTLLLPAGVDTKLQPQWRLMRVCGEVGVDADTDAVTDAYTVTGADAGVDTGAERGAGAGPAAVLVRGFFCADELQDLYGEEGGEGMGDLAVAKEDLLQLLATGGLVGAGRVDAAGDAEAVLAAVCRVHLYSGEEQVQEQEGGQDEQGQGCFEYVAVAAFASAQSGRAALLHLDERVLGGSRIVAHLQMQHAQAPAGAAVRGAGMEGEAWAEAGAGAGPKWGRGEIVAHFEVPSVPEGAQTRVGAGAGVRVGSISADGLLCVYSMGVAEEEGGAGAAVDASASAVGAASLVVGDRPASKYVAAAALPKPAPHAAPRTVSPALRIKIADDATNTALRELLRLLSSFQARLKATDPQKAKDKIRFVSGLNECTRAVRKGKVRLLLLAPNTEDNGVVDERIDLLLGEAAAKEVPACYCLSRRLLGKALGLSMKQSAVAVLDPDGAFQYFKAVIRNIGAEKY